MFSGMYTMLPVRDMNRARAFYRDKLGLEPTGEKAGRLMYSGPTGHVFQLYETEAVGTAQNTQMGFSSSDLDQDMAELRERGVVFEDYDFPEFTTENGVATDGDERSAWFKDTEGNTLCLSQSLAR